MAVIKQMNPLEKIDYTKLDYQQIMDDIRAMLEIHPQYKTLWQDFLESNAGQMLMETFAYITSKMMMRADFIANELFLPTAQDPTAVVNILKLIGYNLTPPTAGVVPVQLSTTDGSVITIPSGIIPTSLGAISGMGLDGTAISFEICNSENDYDTPIQFENTNSIVTWAFAGLRSRDDITVTSRENFSYKINSTNVIKGSLFVYYAEDLENPLEEITSLMLFDKDDLGRPRYVVSWDENFSPTITFGRENYGGAFEQIIDGIPETYQSLVIYYRSGGGANSNVTLGSISTQITANGMYSLNVTNIEAGVGGSDGQTLEEAKLYAPLATKTVNKTVTQEDYTTLLQSQSEVAVWDVSIDSPYEDPERVPYLFNYIYLSPQRNWNDFILETKKEGDEEFDKKRIPMYVSGETIESYRTRFLIRLNNFLNIIEIADLDEELYRNDSLGIVETGYTNDTLYYPDKDENATQYTDEARYLYYSFLLDKKVTGIENIFRIADFKPFTINGTLYYKKGYNPVTTLEKIKAGIREQYGIDKAKFGHIIKTSEIYSLIHSYPEVSYFQMESPSANIQPELNEIYFVLPKEVIDLMPTQSSYLYDINITMLKE